MSDSLFELAKFRADLERAALPTTSEVFTACGPTARAFANAIEAVCTELNAETIRRLRGDPEKGLWWTKVIGEGASHVPSGEIRSIKHLHPAMVQPIYEAHKGTAVADVIAGLVFHIAITENREQFLVADATERATKAEAERDEAIKDRDAQAAHVLKVAAEARDGFAALEEIDACWDAYGTASNRMNLTLSEQIASTLRELEDMSENYGNAEGELKMAQAEIEELRTAARSAQKEGA